jgi:hypothetical protein
MPQSRGLSASRGKSLSDDPVPGPLFLAAGRQPVPFPFLMYHLCKWYPLVFLLAFFMSSLALLCTNCTPPAKHLKVSFGTSLRPPPALLACTQKTHVSGERSRTRYECSIASCDFLLHQSAHKNRPILFRTHPTPPRPTSANLEAGRELFSLIWSSNVRQSTKLGSRRKGTVDDGLSGVSGLSRKISSGDLLAGRSMVGKTSP